MLSSMGEAHPRALAQAIGVDATRLRRIMHGYPPMYSIELSPISMELAVLVRSPAGQAYRITNRGRVKARQLTSRRVRDAAGRRGRAEAARRTVPVSPRPPVPAPLVASGFTCTYTLPWHQADTQDVRSGIS